MMERAICFLPSSSLVITAFMLTCSSVAIHSAIELSEDIVRPKLKSGWIPVSCKTASKKEIRDYIGGRNG